MAVPAILVAAGLVIGQASGIISTAADILTGIDRSITAVVDLRGYVPQVKTFLHPPKPVVVKAARKKP